MIHSFYDNFKVLHNIDVDPGATATTGVEGSDIDLAGYDGVVGICPVASSKAASGVLTLQYQGVDTTTGTYVTMDSVAVGAGEAGINAVLDIVRPLNRFGRFRIVTSGNGASPHGGVVAIPYRGSLTPQAQSTADVVDTSKKVVEPTST